MDGTQIPGETGTLTRKQGPLKEVRKAWCALDKLEFLKQGQRLLGNRLEEHEGPSWKLVQEATVTITEGTRVHLSPVMGNVRSQNNGQDQVIHS